MRRSLTRPNELGTGLGGPCAEPVAEGPVDLDQQRNFASFGQSSVAVHSSRASSMNASWEDEDIGLGGRCSQCR